MEDLSFTKWHWDRFFSRSFWFPRQYHSTIAPYSSSSKCCSYQEGKELKPGDLPKSNALSLIWGALGRKILSMLSDFQGLKVCSTVTYPRECSWLVQWVESLNSYVDGLRKPYRSCPKRESLSLYDPFPTGRHLLSVSFIKSVKSNLWTALTKYNTTKNNTKQDSVFFTTIHRLLVTNKGHSVFPSAKKNCQGQLKTPQ